jgi:glucuronosyltransferase
MSHCGIGSVREAKFHSVPIIAIPLFSDQTSNADTIVKEGWGIRIDFKTLREDDIVQAVTEIIQNPKYKESVKFLSDLYRDRPISALETAIFWVEHVLKYHGAPHLHYFGADQNFIVRNSIDVIGLTVLILFVIFKIFIKIGKFVCKKLIALFRGGKTGASKKTN